jgi:hypothetical protein
MSNTIYIPSTEQLIAVAYHEASHHVAATKFVPGSEAMLTPNGYIHPNSGEVKPWAGVCLHDTTRTKFQEAVISWAGVLGAHMMGVRYDWSPPVPLKAKFAKDWFHMFLINGFNHQSREDQIGIMGDKRQWRTFKTAWKILSKNRARIKRLAEAIVAAQDPKRKEIENMNLSLTDRARALETLLQSLTEDHPDRPQLVEALNCLRRGENPPANLFEPSPAVNHESASDKS